MFECVCVYVVNEITTPCHAKKSTARSIDSGLTGQIRRARGGDNQSGPQASPPHQRSAGMANQRAIQDELIHSTENFPQDVLKARLDSNELCIQRTC